jgi:hypothetical protein
MPLPHQLRLGRGVHRSRNERRAIKAKIYQVGHMIMCQAELCTEAEISLGTIMESKDQVVLLNSSYHNNILLLHYLTFT